MATHAFKAFKSDDGYFSIVGFNGDCCTTKNPDTCREFAHYITKKFNEKRHTEETGAASSDTAYARTTTPGDPGSYSCAGT